MPRTAAPPSSWPLTAPRTCGCERGSGNVTVTHAGHRHVEPGHADVGAGPAAHLAARLCARGRCVRGVAVAMQGDAEARRCLGRCGRGWQQPCSPCCAPLHTSCATALPPSLPSTPASAMPRPRSRPRPSSTSPTACRGGERVTAAVASSCGNRASATRRKSMPGHALTAAAPRASIGGMHVAALPVIMLQRGPRAKRCLLAPSSPGP